MASQPQYIPQFIAPPGGTNDSTTTIIILFVVVILMVSMGVSMYFLFFRKVEGGKCKLDDEDDQDKQGIYEYDEDLECVLESCKKGYEISGTSCIKEKKVGDTCPGVDSRGTYKLDAFKNCILKNCSTGYKVSGDKCVPDDDVNPCEGITDSTSASQIPVPCLKQTLLDVGCSKLGEFYTRVEPAATSWWRGDNKVGNYGKMKEDMENWSNNLDSGCYKPAVPDYIMAGAAPCPITHFRNSLGDCQEIGNICQSGWVPNSQGKCVDWGGCEFPLSFDDGSCE